MAPSGISSVAPSGIPSVAPTVTPSVAPSGIPSVAPTVTLVWLLLLSLVVSLVVVWTCSEIILIIKVHIYH